MTDENVIQETRASLSVGGRRVQVSVMSRASAPELETPGQAPVGSYVIICHGFKGFMDWGFFPPLRRAFAEAGFIAIAMNASGCGVGDDPLVMDDDEAFFHDTYSRQLEDIAAVRSYARTLPGVDPAREILFGHSRGGGMMVLAAASARPRGLVLWAPIDEADRCDAAMKERWRKDGVLLTTNGRTGQVHRMSVAMLDEYEAEPKRFDIVAAAARIDAPVLAVHGADDASVPPSASKRIAAAAPQGQCVIFDGGDHSFGASHPMVDFDGAPLLARAAARSIEHSIATCET